MISDERRCIFVHIPKTGGTSLEEVIWPGPRSEGQLWMGMTSPYHNKYQTGALQHLLAQQILTEVGSRRFFSYYKFSIVRNPYDRIVSQFIFMRSWQDLRQSIGMKDDDSFSRYLALISEVKHVQWEQQASFIHDADNRLMVDFVGRYERYEEDARQILARLGLRVAALPHALRGERGPYRDYYRPGDRARVARMFERDIECFKYRF